MGPFLMARTDLAVRRSLRAEGKGFFTINRAMRNLNENLIQGAVAEANVAHPGIMAKWEQLTGDEEILANGTLQLPEGAVGAFGDGELLKKLIAAFEAFAASDFGKIVIEAIKAALLALIGL